MGFRKYNNEGCLGIEKPFSPSKISAEDQHCMKMFHRMVNPRRVLMVLASFRRTLNPQDYTIFTDTYPQIRQVRTLPQVFKPRNYCSVAEAKVEEANQVLSLLQAKDWCNETEEKLNCLTDISVDHVVSALKNLDPAKALSFFTWYNKHPSYKPSSPVYNAMLRRLCKKTHIEKFWELAEEMKSHGFLMEQHTFSVAKLKLRKQGMVEDMVNVFIWMAENSKEKPTFSNCFRVMQFLAMTELTDSDAATRVIEAYKNLGGSMDKKIYESLQRCHTKAGQLEEARKVMDTMTKEGFTPDNVSYGQLIFGLCKANRLGDACNVINEMKEKGCLPQVKTWTVLIEGHCKADETDKALALVSEMTESGCAMDAYILQALVVHLCGKNREMDAYNLLCKSVEEQKITPFFDTYSEVIEKLTQSSMLKEACKVFDVMKELNHFPELCVALAKPIIGLLSKSGTVDEAYSFVSKVKQNGMSGKACTAMVEAFWKENRQSDAHDLVSRLPRSIANNPLITDITKTRSADKPKSEDPTESSQKVETSPKGKVAKKGKKSQKKTKNGSSVKKVSSNDKAEQHGSSSGETEHQEDCEAKVKDSS